MAGSVGPGSVVDRGHQALRDTRAVGRRIDVEAMQLEGVGRLDTGRRRPPSHLGVADQPAAGLGEQREHRGACQLGGLLHDAVGVAHVRPHVRRGGVVGERLGERACGKGRQRGGVLDRARTDVHGVSQSARPSPTAAAPGTSR